MKIKIFLKTIKNKILIALIACCISPVYALDASTPKDGNLFIDLSFNPSQMKIYDNAQILKEKNIEFLNNRIFNSDDSKENVTHINRTLNTDITWLDNDSYVVLTGNSKRYPHGILGDKIESTGFEIFKNDKLSYKYELPEDRVFETLRALVADLIPENPGKEIILTSSNISDGARVEVYSQNAQLLGVSKSIGRGYRWLHTLAVAPVKGSQTKYLALVKTPHINGVLELLFWNGEYLKTESSYRDVSTHQIGSANLNTALLINTDNSPDIEIVLPSFDFRKLLILKYSEDKIIEKNSFDLPGKISSNIYYENSSSPSIWAGLSDGKIIRIY